jgi:hypothetical protein
MPERSSIQSFINAIKTGQTTITRGLQRLWDERNTLDPALLNRVTTLTLSPLDAAVKTALGQRGLGTKELDHIDEWPDSEKQKVRTAILQARNSDPQRHIEFSWELYNGTVSVAQIDNLHGPGAIRIRFRSPRDNVRVATDLTGELHVDLEGQETGSSMAS